MTFRVSSIVGLFVLAACGGSSSSTSSDSSSSSAASSSGAMQGLTLSGASDAKANGTYQLTGIDQMLPGNITQILFTDATKTRTLELNYTTASSVISSVIWTDPALSGPSHSVDCTTGGKDDPCTKGAIKIDSMAHRATFTAASVFDITAMPPVKDGQLDGEVTW